MVLPVPGLPTKTRCRVIVGTLRPAASRLASILSTATWRWISPLTRVEADERVELGEQLLQRLRRRLGLLRGGRVCRLLRSGCHGRRGGLGGLAGPVVDLGVGSRGRGSSAGPRRRPPTILVSASRTAFSCWVTALPDSAAMRSISSSVSRRPGSLGTARQVAAAPAATARRGHVRRPAGRPRPSRRCPSPAGSGVPSVAAAVQTSLSAVA